MLCCLSLSSPQSSPQGKGRRNNYTPHQLQQTLKKTQKQLNLQNPSQIQVGRVDQLAQLFMSKGWRGQTQGLTFITGAYGISLQSLRDVYAIDVFQLDFIWDTSMKQHPHKRKHHAMRRRGQALTRVGGQEHTVPTPAADTSGFQSRRNASGAVWCLFFRLFFFFFLKHKSTPAVRDPAVRNGVPT